MEALIWLIAIVVFLLVEAAGPALVSLWFAGGAAVALVVCLCGGPFWLQAAAFFVVSGILLALLRPLTRKFLTPGITRTNVDSVAGTEGYVLEAIDNLAATGLVKLGAMEWSARSTTGHPIAVGTLVRADRVEGVKVFVTPVQIPAETK